MIGPAWEAQFTNKEQVQTVLLDTLYNQEKKSYNFTEEVLKEMVRQVSEDKENETLEFNEFLTMLGLQNIENIKFASLFEAFR